MGLSGSSLAITIDLPPPVPQGLTAIALDTRVLLVWSRNGENDVVGYNIYRDGNLVPLAYVAQPPVGSTPTLTDYALTNGRQYLYQIQAVDARGNKSALGFGVLGTPVSGPEWGQ